MKRLVVDAGVAIKWVGSKLRRPTGATYASAIRTLPDAAAET